MTTPTINNLPKCREFKWVKKINPSTNVTYYDIENEYQEDPLEVIKSKIFIRLSTLKGEWAADNDFGLPLGAIKQNSQNPDVVAKLIADEIFKVQYVNNVSVDFKDINSSTRLFTASYTVDTIFGQISGETTL